jgi:hypothetical protein
MPTSNITPARVAGNYFYIKAPDRRLFRLGHAALQLEQFVFGTNKKTRLGSSPSNPRTELEELGKTLFPRS